MSYEDAEGFRIRNQSATYFLNFTIMGWIDIFSRQVYRDIVLESMRYCQQNKGLKIGAYVIMSNHIHTIWTAEHNNLSDIVRDFKTHTSKAISNAVITENESRKEWLKYMFEFFGRRTNANKYFKIWTSNNHPEEIYSRDFLLTKLNYIHNNPVGAFLVSEPEHYLYSSASNYLNGKGLLDIDFLL